MTGCVGLVFAEGPLVTGKVKMTIDLNWSYKASSSANTVVGLAGEYYFGQNWDCQNALFDRATGLIAKDRVFPERSKCCMSNTGG